MAKKNKKNEAREFLTALILFLVIVAVIVSLIILLRTEDSSQPQRPVMSTEYMDEAPPIPFEIDGFEVLAGCPLGALNDRLSLTCLGRYTESQTLAVIVENIGTELVSHAEVKINTGYLDAFFEVEHLPAGGSILVLESSGMEYDELMDFRTPLALDVSTAGARTDYASDFLITVENGILTLENCSGRDFTEPVGVCCKTILPCGVYFDRTVLLGTEGTFANGETRYFNFSEDTEIVCMQYPG